MNGENMAQVLLFAGVLSGILLIVNQVVKVTVPNFPTRFIPLQSIVLGILIGAISDPFTDLNIVLRLWAGFFAGASAVGLFELGKQTAAKPPEDQLY